MYFIFVDYVSLYLFIVWFYIYELNEYFRKMFFLDFNIYLFYDVCSFYVKCWFYKMNISMNLF